MMRQLIPVADGTSLEAASVPRRPEETLPGRLLLQASGDSDFPDYFLFLPDKPDPALPPLVCVHGISRNAEDHVKAFAAFAAQQGRMVIAPHFDDIRFDGFQRLARGTEEAVESMWRDVERVTGGALGAVDMVGFSGGAQFTHRYAMLNPQRVNSQVLVAAGWYTFPNEGDRFPYGIKRESRRGRRAAENLLSFLAIPTLVLVGAKDNQRDAALRRTPEVDIKQGINRIERASRWACTFLQAATRAGVSPTVQFAMLPGCGHAFDDCVEKGGLVGLICHWLQRDSLI